MCVGNKKVTDVLESQTCLCHLVKNAITSPSIHHHSSPTFTPHYKTGVVTSGDHRISRT